MYSFTKQFAYDYGIEISRLAYILVIVDIKKLFVTAKLPGKGNE